MAENQNPGQGGKQGISNRPDDMEKQGGGKNDQFQNDRDANQQGERTRGREDEKSGQSNQQGGQSGQKNQGDKQGQNR